MSDEFTPIRPVSWAVFDRYLAGECTPDERLAIESLVAKDPAAYDALAALQTELAVGLEPTRAEAAASLALLQARRPELRGRGIGIEDPRDAARAVDQIGHANPISASKKIGSAGWPTPRHILGGARQAFLVSLGAIVVLAGMGLYRTGRFGAATPSQSYVTTIGQRATFTLPDGSHLVLAPQSRFVISAGFGTQNRTATLHGEAYFDIASAAGTPFIVRTGSVTTRVLGTVFSVRHYDNEAVHVSVVRGKVITGVSARSVTLTAGMTGQVTDSTATITALADIDAYTGWAQGRLVFDKAPVTDVLTTVGRWYGYQFRITDPTLSAQHVTATFSTDRPTKTIALLKEILDVDMTFDGSLITLHSRHGVHATDPAGHTRRDTFSTSREFGK